MSVELESLEHRPGEDPFIVTKGGFYRRWLRMIDDLEELKSFVSKLSGTTEDRWVPVWRLAGERRESEGDALAEAGYHAAARRAYLAAKTYYAIGRFPGEITPTKADISADCARAYRKACAHLDPPIEVIDVDCEGQSFRAHFRAPSGPGPHPAILIMCGSDVVKEDRGWASDMALDAGLASLVMDAPGTGENPFPWEPKSVKAWVAGVDALAERTEVDGARIGAFGISRGGYSVMQLAGTAPERIKAVVAVAGHPFGHKMTEAEMEEVSAYRNRRAELKFGAPDGPTSFPRWSVEIERDLHAKWSLEALGILDRIIMPVLMINGDADPLAPIGNIHFMLESGPVGTRSARVYGGSGHCAFEHQPEWGPAAFSWLAERLSN